MGSLMSDEYLLEMRDIIKEFSGVRALDKVNFEVKSSEVVSLCGENGSGKSTLMKIVSGIYPYGQYSGNISFNGHLIEPKNIRDTEDAGIAIIHQELALIKELPILENLFLGNEISKFGVMSYDLMYKKSVELLSRVSLDLDPYMPVKELGMGQQQLVEIAKALGKNAKLLILDEPSSSLTNAEIDILLDIVKSLRRQGVSCVYISHKLNEVMEISDRICVIRDGLHIGTLPVKEMSEEKIIQMMVGRELNELFPRDNHPIGDVIFEAKHVMAAESENSVIKKVNDVSFSLRKGEILGVSGLVGAGRTELMQCVFGCFPGYHQKELWLDGKKVSIRNCRDALELGIAMVPEDRKKDGIVPIMGVGKNITLAALDKYQSLGILNNRTETEAINESIKKLRVKTSSSELPIKGLSGGNQQKAILAKYLLLKPKILILDEPTRGIDVGAKYEIYKLMFELVKQGLSIIMVSSELPEVLGISDRVLVMSEGKLTANLDNNNLSQKTVMDYALAHGGAAHG